ncbi:glycosyltransferase family 22 protein [Pseudocercospora fijiensis CIRAD86]|uniref:Mannosyltransferase n=1 Tax=Pseudocercospora fijiensis (strain CIRAD86) TaxID=383855 RepID=M2YTD6_PSEFD|nr:glycosyltransferase family 22 protein [Pseudocercospora fijiensis CIRAD86]EME81020.1 glycosyltransferase family 22 protein [Pseudocercospora fijiensis CIRAD86]
MIWKERLVLEKSQSFPDPACRQSAFCVLFGSHLVAALYSPVQDCDEVFNYWEATHYLNHGHGFQTWEYSPAYAIRSWTYAALHALVTPLATFLPSAPPKLAQFYLLRIVLGLVCALCETRLFSTITSTLNPRVAIFYLFVTITAPGMYHAATAYLPSAFAMYCVALGIAAFMDWRGGLRTAQGIWCFGIGACIGWPFAAAMALPFLGEELLLASLSDWVGRKELFWRVVDGVVRTLLVLSVQVAVDCFFYKKLTIVPLNMVWYNVFSSRGPHLYGTEPWHFYLRNLFLNFHLWLILALLSMPLLFAQHFLKAKAATKASYLRGAIFLSPFYLWLAIFTLQPHKEERFMYPAYPALALNAAVAFHIILANLGSNDAKDFVGKIPVQLRLLAIIAFVTLATALAAFRTVGTMTAYQAPLSIYEPLHRPGVSKPGDQVCLGKEWYRFPSHYLLPEGVRAKFIRSEFRGLLPGEFSEAGQGFGLFPGTWLVPPGMNDENREDLGKYTDLKRCNFIVDVNLPSTETTTAEPNFLADDQHWEKVKCLPFLDATSTNSIARLGWIPDLPFVPLKYKPVYGDYCLLKRRKQSASDTKQPLPSIETLL